MDSLPNFLTHGSPLHHLTCLKRRASDKRTATETSGSYVLSSMKKTQLLQKILKKKGFIHLVSRVHSYSSIEGEREGEGEGEREP